MKAVRRPIATLLMAALLVLGLPVPCQAHPGDDETSHARRQRIEQLVERALVENGVDPAQARARAAALTDEEAARVAAEIDKLPAGGVDPATGFWAVIAAGILVLVIIALPIILIIKLTGAHDGGSTEERAADPHQEPQY